MIKEGIHVFAIAALSADGFIGQDEGHVSTKWTSEEDKQWFWDRTKDAGAVVMGSTTFFATRKPGWPLPERMNYVLTREPAEIWNRYASDEERAEVKDKTNLTYLAAQPEEVVNRALADQYAELAVCGGTSVYTAFLPLIDTFYLTREPVELGSGLPLIKGLPGEDLDAMLERDFDLTEEVAMNDQGTHRQTWERKHS